MEDHPQNDEVNRQLTTPQIRKMKKKGGATNVAPEHSGPILGRFGISFFRGIELDCRISNGEITMLYYWLP